MRAFQKGIHDLVNVKAFYRKTPLKKLENAREKFKVVLKELYDSPAYKANEYTIMRLVYNEKEIMS